MSNFSFSQSAHVNAGKGSVLAHGDRFISAAIWALAVEALKEQGAGEPVSVEFTRGDSETFKSPAGYILDCESESEATAILVRPSGGIVDIRIFNDKRRPATAFLFRRRRPGEDREQAKQHVRFGFVDLRVFVEGVATERTLVTVECYAQDIVPAAQAVVEELRRLYPEARFGETEAGGKKRQGGPAEKVEAEDRVPQRRKHFNRWVAIWWKVADDVVKGYDVKTILQRHRGLCSYDTMLRVIAAGREGLLDRKA